MTVEWKMLPVGGQEMGCYIARPEKPNGAGMIVLQEAFGVSAHIQDIATRFAKEGYLTVAPELFHRTAPNGFTSPYGDMAALQPHFKEITIDGVAADVTAAYKLLTDEGIERIGAIGFCMGGRAAFIANAALELNAAVSFYGGGIAQNLLDKAKAQHAPILFFWGGLDKHILREHRDAVVNAMREAGKEFINVEISAADHAFFNNEREAYSAIHAREAWALTKEFLAARLLQ